MIQSKNLTDYEKIQVAAIKAWKNKNIELSGKVANRIHNWAIGIAAAEGGVTGTAGIIGLAADIPAIITFALRTIHKVGLCYGYECHSEMDKNFVLAILSASGASVNGWYIKDVGWQHAGYFKRDS